MHTVTQTAKVMRKVKFLFFQLLESLGTAARHFSKTVTANKLIKPAQLT